MAIKKRLVGKSKWIKPWPYLAEDRPGLFDEIIHGHLFEAHFGKLEEFDKELYDAVKDASWDKKYNAVVWMLDKRLKGAIAAKSPAPSANVIKRKPLIVRPKP